MCNACGNICCGSDEFGGCGCDGCFEPECHSSCPFCDSDSCDEDCQTDDDAQHLFEEMLDDLG